MDTRWFTQFNAVDPDAKDKTKKSVLAAKHILDAVIGILEKEKAALERPKKDDYDCPSWAYKQAHINGEIANINKVIDLLTVKEK